MTQALTQISSQAAQSHTHVNLAAFATLISLIATLAGGIGYDATQSEEGKAPSLANKILKIVTCLGASSTVASLVSLIYLARKSIK